MPIPIPEMIVIIMGILVFAALSTYRPGLVSGVASISISQRGPQIGSELESEGWTDGRNANQSVYRGPIVCIMIFDALIYSHSE